MDLKEKNSTNLDLETVRLSQEKNKEKAESFKVIPENGFNHGKYKIFKRKDKNRIRNKFEFIMNSLKLYK